VSLLIKNQPQTVTTDDNQNQKILEQLENVQEQLEKIKLSNEDNLNLHNDAYEAEKEIRKEIQDMKSIINQFSKSNTFPGAKNNNLVNDHDSG
jgi:hypothetical protein